ncbi:hypothetical protein EC988_004030, partial [Linderina pennispora]
MANGVYAIKQILGRRISLRDGVWYLIEWENYDLKDSTWQCDNAETSISPDSIREFELNCNKLREKRARNEI